MLNWHRKSHEALLRLLNNIGIIGAILAAVADVIFVVIAVIGIKVDMQPFGIVLYAVVNALIGVLISCLLRYQGVKYAEVENQELCDQYYEKKIRDKKKHVPLGWWMTLKSVQDLLIKGCTTAFCLFGVTYITIEGSKNPIQILITFATLVLMTCFGLIAMNGSYCRFYNLQVPMMKLKVEERNANTPTETEKGTLVDCNKDKTADKVTVEQFIEERDKVRQIVNQSLTAQDEVNKVIEQINNEFNPQLAEQTHKWCEEHIVE